MNKVVQKSWEVRRNKAIKRLVQAWEKYDDTSDDDCEVVNSAADAVTVAHIAAAFEWEGRPPKDWHDEGEKALERLVRAWGKYDGTDEHPEVEEALNMALDAFAIAHAAASFEWASGRLKW